ncbi:hypothetical protein CK493_20710 [Shigella sonnei]|nr:hypothetical protein CK493_20710 [Shigella sonnei]
MVICFDLAIDQIAQSGLSSLKVIYYSAQLFRTILALYPSARIILHPARHAGFHWCEVVHFPCEKVRKSAVNKERELTPECTIITIRPL